MGLNRNHLRQAHYNRRDILRHPVRRLGGSTFGQVDHHRQFGLVVEGQVLDRDMLGAGYE